MLRRLHSLPGLVAAVLVVFMALTGAMLSLQPALQQAQTPADTVAGESVAALAGAVKASHPGVQRLVRSASGMLVAYSSGTSGASADIVDPATGKSIAPYAPSAFFEFLTELHRSMFLGSGGHAAAGVGALSLLVLSISGTLLLVSRMGGWSRLLNPARGSQSQRLHVELARLAIFGLLLSALTGIYMSLISFGIIGDGSAGGFLSFPANVDGGTPITVSDLAGLQATPLSDLRELVFPAAGDAGDVFTLTTSAGQGYVDQATGAVLGFTPNTAAQTVYEAFYMLHTGQGIWWLGLLLGLSALAAPVMAASGAVIWWRRRSNRPRLAGNVGAHAADTIILVGSENNTTWGFAANLHDTLRAAGHRVHTGAMNDLARSYPHGRQMFILAATHGDGAAPASANKFLARLAANHASPNLGFAVLGFGDRSFAHFCQFAGDVEKALVEKGWHRLLPMATVDRQSPQAFAQWGESVGTALGMSLELTHVPPQPRTTALVLTGRVDYGQDVQAPTAVLRFAVPDEGARRRWWQLGTPRRELPVCEPGDLVGIVPPGSAVPRYYSLASGSASGFLEICVRKQTGGLCSEFLHALEPGSTVSAFVRSNPGFRPAAGKAPVIMIGAGTGIAPYVGFIWDNDARRSIHLYWGGRDPQSDFLYGDTLESCVDDARLTAFSPAFSRVVGGGYVQDKVREDAPTIRELVARGAQIMVCGGRDMALGVKSAIDDVLLPLGIDVASMKAKGRYLEDVY